MVVVVDKSSSRGRRMGQDIGRNAYLVTVIKLKLHVNELNLIFYKQKHIKINIYLHANISIYEYAYVHVKHYIIDISISYNTNTYGNWYC